MATGGSNRTENRRFQSGSDRFSGTAGSGSLFAGTGTDPDFSGFGFGSSRFRFSPVPITVPGRF
ncbi:hypothetical protein JCGZ_08289 [Jatropha curcas]|uniref:Uncharacterized protein n=1 Tax=Jatropha curcas TaxID=180498 RepID=A0A067KR07_JATCU|nr:hypothetical protein JCGZ_08289 [Jatropha curcas]